MSNRFLSWFMSGLGWALMTGAWFDGRVLLTILILPMVIASYWFPEFYEWAERTGVKHGDKFVTWMNRRDGKDDC